MESLLSVRGLGRTGRDGKRLLENVDLDLFAGERVAVVGPSGAGKSLLLRALAQLDPVDYTPGAEGAGLRFRGQPVEDSKIPAFRRQVAYVQQSPALEDGPVLRSLEAAFELSTASFELSRPRAEELLAELGREGDFLDRAASELSGGEAQIVALVRVLLVDPVVLLLDEPTSALDRETAQRALSLLEAWLAESPGERAWLWVTHERRLEEKVSSRVIRMEAGRVRGGASDGEGAS